MKFTKETINDLADKILIGLNEEENKITLEEFKVIDDNMNKILDIEGISDVKPMTHALDLEITNILDDDFYENDNVEDLLKNCDKVSGREVKTPRVVN